MTIHSDTQHELARLRLEERLARSLAVYDAMPDPRPETLDVAVRMFSWRRTRVLAWGRALLPHRYGHARIA